MFRKILFPLLALLLKKAGVALKNLFSSAVEKVMDLASKEKAVISFKDSNKEQQSTTYRNFFGKKPIRNEIDMRIASLKKDENIAIYKNGHILHANKNTDKSVIDAFMKTSEIDLLKVTKQEKSLFDKIRNPITNYFGGNDAVITKVNFNGEKIDISNNSISLNRLKSNTLDQVKDLKNGEHLIIERNGKRIALNNESTTKTINSFVNNSYPDKYSINQAEERKESLDKLSEKPKELGLESNSVKLTKIEYDSDNKILVKKESSIEKEAIQKEILSLKQGQQIRIDNGSNVSYFSANSKIADVQNFISNSETNKIVKTPEKENVQKTLDNVINGSSKKKELDVYSKKDVKAALSTKLDDSKKLDALLTKDLSSSNKSDIENAKLKLAAVTSEKDKTEKLLKVYNRPFKKSQIPNKELTQLGINKNGLSKANVDLLLSGEKTKAVTVKTNENLDMKVHLKMVVNEQGKPEMRIYPATLELTKTNKQKLAEFIVNNKEVNATLASAYVTKNVLKGKEFNLESLYNKNRIEKAFEATKGLTKNFDMVVSDIKPDTWIKVDSSVASKYDKSSTPIIKKDDDFYVGLKTDKMSDKALAEHIELLSSGREIEKEKDLSNEKKGTGYTV